MEQRKCSVSIIMPCFNGERFIAQSIQSVIDQPAEEIELIIVNDGSKDSTPDICREFCEKDSRVKLFNIENHGAGFARNYGIDKAAGTWIMFLDADDLYLTDSLSPAFLNRLEEYNKQELDILYSSKCESDMTLQRPVQYMKLKDAQIEHMPELEFWIGVYRREFLKKNNIRFFEYKEQDIESAFRYRTFSKAVNYKVDPSSCFYLRRLNPTSNIHTWNLFTLHYVKAKVYSELLAECEVEKDKKWLYEVIQEEIYEFYKEMMHAPCNNPAYIKWINDEFSRSLKSKYRKSTSRHEIKVHYGNQVLHFAANIAQKQNRAPDEVKAGPVSVSTDNKVIHCRLAAISNYVTTCILPDLDA